MRVITKYTYPEKGTRNGRVYSQEVLEKAFNEPAFKELCLTKALLVKDRSDEIIGVGTARLEDGRAVTIDAEVFSPAYIEAIKAADHSFGLTLAGYGNTAYKNGVEIVTDFIIESALLCDHPAIDCSMEIQQED